jgi:hypothetical protein
VAERTWDKRRTLGEVAISLCALLIIVATIVAFDGRVREQVELHVKSDQASSDMAVANAQVRRVAAVLVARAKQQSQQNAPMVIFLVVAGVLTIVMVRT